MPEPLVLFEREDGVATITLNRAHALNAYTLDLAAALGDAIERCQDSSVRAVVVTGAGRAFCAGADIKELLKAMEEGGPEGGARYVTQLVRDLHRSVLLPLRRMPKPVIAAVNGAAAGAGFGLALACDLRIAADEARFVMAFAGLALAADSGATHFLPRLIGAPRAAELYLLNEPLDARRAQQLGIVNTVVTLAELPAKAAEMARKLASGPTLAFARTKALLEGTWTASLEQQLAAEAQAVSETASSADFQEGVQAFTQRRAPSFRGR
ncbi:MAG: enoyl-CoA hydratase [Dehalococcoidia bacterium]|nr:enoyl-CoA hydratase [Dehalococcoidia bacterium]